MKEDAQFEQHRSHLMGIAYRMLGEVAAAEDVVQETWLRWQRAEQSEIRDPRAWLSSAAVRLALDALRAARRRRESYVGPWLPEPLLPDDMRALAADTPARRVELASDLSLALLHVLERLSPEERAAFILHDAFDCDYRDIAATLEKSEEACRKLVSRARERVRSDRPRHSATQDQHRALMQRFATAAALSDQSALLSLFKEDVVLYSDGGGKAKAALNPIFGASRTARFLVGVIRKFARLDELQISFADINGTPGVIIMSANTIHSAATIEADGDQITRVYLVRNPDKLARLQAITSPSSRGSSASA